jgi:hypothetical protein
MTQRDVCPEGKEKLSTPTAMSISSVVGTRTMAVWLRGDGEKEQGVKGQHPHRTDRRCSVAVAAETSP